MESMQGSKESMQGSKNLYSSTFAQVTKEL